MNGGNGILVDPFPLNYALTRLFRRKDKAIRGIISTKTAPIDFYFFEPYEYSTNNPDILEKLRNHMHAKLTEVKSMRPIQLRELQRELDGDYILCVDVEGSELDVIGSADLSDFHLLLICLESGSDWSEISSRLDHSGFFLFRTTLKNSIYLNSRRFTREGIKSDTR